MTSTTEAMSYAELNARGWLASIVDAWATMNHAIDRNDWATVDEQNEWASEAPLSVQVRDGWRNLGEPSNGPEEFCILLSTGGPALRVVGQINSVGPNPDTIRLEHQDWGTPWTALPVDATELDALEWLADRFIYDL